MSYIIEFDYKYIYLKCNERTIKLLWDDILSIDYYIVDRIKDTLPYLSFNTVYGDFIEITKEMKGWSNLIDNLSNFLSIEVKNVNRLCNIISYDEFITIYKK